MRQGELTEFFAELTEFAVKLFSACAPLCCKITCCASRFCTGGGGVAGADPSNVQGPVKQNASPGEHTEAPRPRWKPGQEQNPGPENQDNQHMLEQPRGHFPTVFGDSPQKVPRNNSQVLPPGGSFFTYSWSFLAYS